MRWCRKEWILGVAPMVASVMGMTEAAPAEKAEWVSGDFSQNLPPAMQQAMAWPQPKQDVPPAPAAWDAVGVPPGVIFIAGNRP